MKVITEASGWASGLSSRVEKGGGREDDGCEQALADVKSAIAFHVETFGAASLDTDAAPLEVSMVEIGVDF